MINDFTKFENYINENFDIGVELTNENIQFMKTKLLNVREKFQDMDYELMKVRDDLASTKRECQAKIQEAQIRERLQVEKQKVFAELQKTVESERSKNIREEIALLKEAGITQYNRSSYPFLARYENNNPKKKFERDHKNRQAKKTIVLPILKQEVKE